MPSYRSLLSHREFAGLYLSFTLLVAATTLSGFALATLMPLQEQLLVLTPDAVRGQVQGVESAGRMTWQGIGAAIAGDLAQVLPTAATITLLAAMSLAITLVSRRFVARAPVAAGDQLGR